MRTHNFYRKRFLFPLILFMLCSISLQADETLEAVRKAIREKGARWTAEENWVTRLSREEQKRMNGTLPDFPDPAKAMRVRFPREESLPSHFDWRNNNGNWVTPVKNQGDCGSCWDFSAVAQVESWYKITRNELFSDIDLSEQFVLSCSDGTCDGWSISLALDFIRDVGVPTEECFHYFANDEVACDEACDWWEDEAITIPGWGFVTLNEADVENIKSAVYRHPVSARYDVYEDFSYYGGGIYEHVYGDFLAGHAILIVGWDDAEQYWICKNSWSSWWGENGYFRIRWGQCGIGQNVPFIWSGEMTGPALQVTPDTLVIEMEVGDSAQYVISLQNSGSDPLEYFAADFESPIAFHVSSFNAYSGTSWWCGNDALQGYDNHWLQFLDTPVLDLSGTQNPVLNFAAYWSIEDPAGTEDPWDGWDGCNVWVSMDGGDSFQVLTPDFPSYTCMSLWSFGNPDEGWDMGEGIPGWAGFSGGWQSAQFDLSAWKSDQAVIRFAFASDLGWCTRDESGLTGFFVDNIRISDGAELLFEDNGEAGSPMIASGEGVLEAPWLVLSPGAGDIPALGTQILDVSVSARNLIEGTYHAFIFIFTNDSLSPYVEVPLILQVQAATEVDGQDILSGPRTWKLFPNYPNPFNASTLIPYQISERERVRISVFDHAGRLVRTLVNADQPAGYYQVQWDGTDSHGTPVGTGVYVVRMRTSGGIQTQKLLLIK
jgi:C1A family cysteine protease